MPKFSVHIPDADFSAGGLNRLTPNEFIARYGVKEGESQVFTLKPAVRLGWVEADERTRHRETHRRSTALFRFFDLLRRQRGLLTSVCWGAWRIGPQGLFALNHAIHTARGRKDGLSIVRAFLEDRPGPRTPLRCDWPALLDYLEIRPLFARETVESAPAPTPPKSVSSPATLSIMSSHGLDITKDKSGRVNRSRRVRSKS